MKSFGDKQISFYLLELGGSADVKLLPVNLRRHLALLSVRRGFVNRHALQLDDWHSEIPRFGRGMLNRLARRYSEAVEVRVKLQS